MRAIFLLLAACVLSACSSGGSQNTAPPSWGYSGDNGPEHWASLSKANAACAGVEQSPIDLANATSAGVEDIIPHWATFRPIVENNGHTIQANAPAGSTTTFGGQTYNLLQVHWHAQSEHTVGGLHAPLEAHFVHENPETKALMVLGVMMVEGAANPQVQTIWNVAPSGKGKAQTKAGTDWTGMLPSDKTVYRYAGSLTTPPCSETVSWAVFKTPVTVSRAQIDAFATLYPANNRPVQPVGRRFLLLGQ